MPWVAKPSPASERMKSPSSPTEPTVMAGLPVSFLVSRQD